MRRAGILLPFVVVALVSDVCRARAQAPANTNTNSLSITDSVIAPPIVRITSRHLPFEARDLLLANCTWIPQDALAFLVPYLCVRHMSGTLERVDADSVVFMRNGHPIRVAMRDVRALQQLKGRSTPRTVAGATLGGAVGVFYAAMIGIGGAYRTDAQFAATAVVLGAGGAVIGGSSMGRIWTDWPRTFAAPATTQR